MFYKAPQPTLVQATMFGSPLVAGGFPNYVLVQHNSQLQARFNFIKNVCDLDLGKPGWSHRGDSSVCTP